MKINLVWLRRDLRWEDHTALTHALMEGIPVLPVFIFDTEILAQLPQEDARVSFIYDILHAMHLKLLKHQSGILVKQGKPLEVWKHLMRDFEIHAVYITTDYEPYARSRDEAVRKLLERRGIPLFSYKDQVIYEENEITKDDGKPYTVFTPYKKKWLKHFQNNSLKIHKLPNFEFFFKHTAPFPSLETIGFKKSEIIVKPFTLGNLNQYAALRDFPARDATSYLSVHLRFGTVSIRKLVEEVKDISDVFLSELIWREFFMQILFHFPQVVTQNFYPKFDKVQWRNNEQDFEKWCKGETGYPMVDAGMRQLNAKGYVHNRVRMVVASFLTKHLLIDWRWGEVYFASKLLDYELSANNGNWQWAAGTGCDAAPYFRVFNPHEQLKKFDSKLEYVRTWIPEFDTLSYPNLMVDHKEARERALKAYQVVKE